jgi:hypothetical protein
MQAGNAASLGCFAIARLSAAPGSYVLGSAGVGRRLGSGSGCGRSSDGDDDLPELATVL